MIKRTIVSLVLVAIICFSIAPSALAADPVLTLDLPAGWACNFDLRIEFFGEGPQVDKQFVDKDGNVLRTLLAGVGYELVFTNLSTNATFSTKPNGAVSRTTINPDGSFTQTSLGHNILIMFPTDVPAGPSTTLIVGRVVIAIDTNGVYTIQKVNAKTTDICAALSE